jgi:hypothetical protein
MHKRPSRSLAIERVGATLEGEVQWRRIVGRNVRTRASMAMIRRDHYSLLGVSRTAEPLEIRRAFKRRALERHPDHAGAHAAGEFQELAGAYHVLADPSRRAAYDAELRRGEPARTGPVLDLRNAPAVRRRADPANHVRGVHRFPDIYPSSDLLEAMFDRLFRDDVDWVVAEPEDEEPVEVVMLLRDGPPRWWNR